PAEQQGANACARLHHDAHVARDGSALERRRFRASEVKSEKLTKLTQGRTIMHYRSLATLAGAALATALLMLVVSAQPLPPTSPPQQAPMLPPAHVVDLLTADGMAAFGAQWKSMDVKIIEGPALPNAMPGYKTSYDISPHAGVKGFDDSSWPTLEPKQLL